uniref:Uncharacterized protein n=1 Tax=Glossina austeni TaxID=7395 RepID=A0A1A9UNA1_GLOAU
MNSKPRGQVKRSTPILFCSNRGLHLRCIKSSSTEEDSSSSSSLSSSNIPFNTKWPPKFSQNFSGTKGLGKKSWRGLRAMYTLISICDCVQRICTAIIRSLFGEANRQELALPNGSTLPMPR